METRVDIDYDSKTRPRPKNDTIPEGSFNPALQFEDNRTETVLQKKLQYHANVSHGIAKLMTLSTTMNPLQRTVNLQQEPLQLMTFNRFSRGGIFTNWGFYSEKENQLLAKEKRLGEQLEELQLEENEKLNTKATQLRQRFQLITAGDFKTGEYTRVEKEIDSIQIDADRLSSKMAIWLKNREHFNDKSGPLPERNTIIPSLHRLIENPLLYNLPELKELLDITGQMVNDSIIFMGDYPELITLKEQVIRASTAAQQAFLAFVILQDEEKATTQLLLCCFILQGLNFEILGQLLDNERVKPKTRESGWRIDAATMMLARSSLLNNVSPDLVVGLPTAGAHIASRYAASIGLITGTAPLVNLTRAHAVKKDSQEMMKGVGEKDYFKEGEFESLVNQLKKRMGKRKNLTIFIVDDGMVSGNTLKITQELYSRKMQSAGFIVDIQIGLSRGNSYVSSNEAVRPDYVVEPRHDWGGNSRIMEQVPEENRKDVGDSYQMDDQWSPRKKLSLEVELVHGTTGKPRKDKVKISDLLQPVESLELEHKSNIK